MRSKILKTILIFIALLIGSLLLLSIIIRTSIVQQRLIKIVQESASKFIGQEINVGKVDLDIINGIVFNNIQMNIDGEEFLRMDALKIGYPLNLSNFINQFTQKQIVINSVEVIKLNLLLKKDDNSKWNYKFLKKDQEDKIKTKKPTEKSSWNIRILTAAIYNSEIVVINNPKDIPRIISINELTSYIDINTGRGISEVNIQKGDISVKPDGLEFSNILSSLKFGREQIKLQNIKFQLNGSPVFLSGELSGTEIKKFNIVSEIKEFRFEKGLLNLALAGSGTFKSIDDIDGRFKINLRNSEYLGNKFSFSANNIKIDKSNLKIENAALYGDFGNARADFASDLQKLFDKNINNEFNASLTLENFKYSKIINFQNIKDMDSLGKKEIILNADLNAHGFFNSKDDFKIRTAINELSVTGNTGSADLKGNAIISDKIIAADIKASLKEFNLKDFIGNDIYESSINSRIDINAEIPLDLTLKLARGNIDIDISESFISGEKIKGGKIYAEFANKKVKNALIEIKSDLLTVSISGKTIDEKLDFKFDLKNGDLSFLSDLKPQININGLLSANGAIAGEISSPIVDYSIDINEFVFKEIKSESIKYRGEFKLQDGLINLISNGIATNLVLGNKKIESLDFRIFNQQNDLLFEIFASAGELENLTADFRLPDFQNNKKIEFSKVIFNIKDFNYQNLQPFTVDLYEGVKIENLQISSGDSSINLFLNLTGNKNINADLNIYNLDLDIISEFLALEEPLSGIMDVELDISGRLEEIIFKTDIRVINLKYREFISESLSMFASYQKHRMLIDLNSKVMGQNNLLLKGYINTKLDLSDINKSLKGSVFDLRIKSEGLNLSPLPKFVNFLNNISGILDLDLQIKGSSDSPEFYGSGTLKKVNVEVKELKNKFTIDNGKIDFKGNRALLKQFLITSGDGKAMLNGDINIIDLNYHLTGTLDKLTVKLSRIRTNLTGDIKLEGQRKQIKVTSTLRLNKTRIKIKEDKKKKVSDIKFVDQQNNDTDEIIIQDKVQGNYFIDNVALDINLKVSSNTWVRGKGANIEMQGNLVIDKDYEDKPVLTGNILTVRGTYKIFGKLFKIQEGNVNFTGDKDINPLIDITALYNVSDVDIFVDISGDVESPRLNLRSDPPLEETDILSYLIFGSSSDKLGAGERSSLNQVATGIAGGVALSEFRKILGEDLSPDVLSFGTGSAGAELEVGKYLTDDLYIAYERKSSLDSSHPIPTNSVKVEYRLFDFISVGTELGSEQSGGDLFFKFDF